MTEPMQVTTDLSKVLERIEQKIDHLQQDVMDLKVGQVRLEADLKGTRETLTADLKGTKETLEAKLDGLAKRLDFQEFVNRGVIIGLILALLGGLAKVLGLSNRL